MVLNSTFGGNVVGGGNWAPLMLLIYMAFDETSAAVVSWVEIVFTLRNGPCKRMPWAVLAYKFPPCIFWVERVFV